MSTRVLPTLPLRNWEEAREWLWNWLEMMGVEGLPEMEGKPQHSNIIPHYQTWLFKMYWPVGDFRVDCYGTITDLRGTFTPRAYCGEYHADDNQPGNRKYVNQALGYD